MAKPEAWRLDSRAYPTFILVPVRFQDLDPMGHINNVALAGIFETARVHFHHCLDVHPSDLGVRWLVAAVDLKYVREAHFPAPVTVYSGISSIGNSSWILIQAAFQDGECVATCDTVMVTHGPKGSRTIDDTVRAAMTANMALRDFA